MSKESHKPRILIVTPEATYLPDRLGSISDCLTAKAGGLADVTASLICELFRQGADVHAAIPNYKTIYRDCLASHLQKDRVALRRVLPDDRLHLAEDRLFFYRDRVYSGNGDDDLEMALVFQREVINNIIPRVAPDLIHCHDWMTALIPAMARRAGIPCLFTLHNIHSMKTTLAAVEQKGIDVASFWDHLYFERMPQSFEESRHGNPIELITCGVFAAHAVTTVSPTFLDEMIGGRHDFVNQPLRMELQHKMAGGRAYGILNAPNTIFDPTTDTAIAHPYGPDDHQPAKRANKIALQRELDLPERPRAPVFFWPSRLDPVQKGCQLLEHILLSILAKYEAQHPQVVFVADGPYQEVFRDIVNMHELHESVAVCAYDERLEHLAYAAADFVLMPSRFEPCGLPQMIGPIYGALPVVHDTGGLHDTVRHLDIGSDTGNGFVFEVFDSNGLFWALDQAMAFYCLPDNEKQRQIQRVMRQSAAAFNYGVTAGQYGQVYVELLQRPVLPAADQ